MVGSNLASVHVLFVGASVGVFVGREDGTGVGNAEGASVGMGEGAADGKDVGALVGCGVGSGVIFVHTPRGSFFPPGFEPGLKPEVSAAFWHACALTRWLSELSAGLHLLPSTW